MPTITQPYFASVLMEAEKEARGAGCDVILFDSGSDDDWAARLARMVRSRQLDGAIVWAPTDWCDRSSPPSTSRPQWAAWP